MELESVKRYLEEKGGGGGGGGGGASTVDVDGLPPIFLESLIVRGLRLDLIEPGRVVFSMKIPSRLLNSTNSLHGGVLATLVDVVGAAAIPSAGYSMNSGVSVEINVSYMDAVNVDEEIEVDARVLRVGKTIAVISVEFRNKKTGKVFAEGRHTKYIPMPLPSKM